MPNNNFQNKRNLILNNSILTNAINGNIINSESAVFNFNFTGGNTAFSGDIIGDKLKLCDGYLLDNDYRIFASSLRMESQVSQIMTSNVPNITSIGIGPDLNGNVSQNYFPVSNSGSIADFIVSNNDLSFRPIQSIKGVRDRALMMTLDQNAIGNFNLIVTIFYIIVPDNRQQMLNNLRISGKVNGKRFTIINKIDQSLDEERENLKEVENELQIGDLLQLHYYNNDKVYNVRITAISSTYFSNDTLTFDETLPSSDNAYIEGAYQYCSEIKCHHHPNIENPKEEKFHSHN